jgi:hypothetical protein
MDLLAPLGPVYQAGTLSGNPIAMAAGIIVVAILSNLPNDLWKMATQQPLYSNFQWMPVIEFPWRIMAGTLVTIAVALCFRSEHSTLDSSGVRNNI